VTTQRPCVEPAKVAAPRERSRKEREPSTEVISEARLASLPALTAARSREKGAEGSA
jgi:hypothetical protein